MGQFGQNHEMAVKDLADAKWKQSAQQVLDTLLKGSPADFSQPFDELVVVPDGVLWYLPFEALQVTVDGQPQSLISRFRIRYAPTLSLAVPPGPGAQPGGQHGRGGGQALSARRATTRRQTAFEQLAAVVPGAVALRPPPPAPSADLQHALRPADRARRPRALRAGSLRLGPAPLDRGKAGGTLADWLALPWGGPDVVILPGFHTAAEDGLKRLHADRPATRCFSPSAG